MSNSEVNYAEKLLNAAHEVSAPAIFHQRFNLLELSKCVINDPKFLEWSGSSRPEQHHYGDGGLARHVWEVVELCLVNNKFLSSIDKGVPPYQIYLAALYHDVGKMWDYEKKPYPANLAEYATTTKLAWGPALHKQRVHHIVRSSLVWNEFADVWDVPEDDKEEILHAIVAHHGCREWGSPVSPDTRLAWLLHLCDSISARTDDCYTLKRH